ncbi:MAG: FxsA family protein [bacterium]
MLRLILIFTIIPLLEITLLIKMSNIFGIIYTVILVGITGLIGAVLSKKQGTSVLQKIRKSIEEGMMPADSLLDGLLILIGGILLITPGIITDLGGFCCIIPLSRARVKKITKNSLSRFISTGTFQFSRGDNNQTSKVNIYDGKRKNTSINDEKKKDQ